MVSAARPETDGPDLADRLRNTKVDALIDAHGDGYVELAVKIVVSPARINTIIDFESAFTQLAQGHIRGKIVRLTLPIKVTT